MAGINSAITVFSQSSLALFIVLGRGKKVTAVSQKRALTRA